ncbi:MAG: 50S ribosomal protein L11 methyltransferase [Prevotella sp.]|nr:50S ribosomal protein L11 methyltransferase [Prevotella sp.]
MKYYAVKFQIECAPELMQTARDLLADDVVRAGFESFEDDENGLIGYVQTDQFNQSMLNEVVAPFAFVVPNVQISYTIEEVEPKNWNETWENEGFNPIFIGDRCVIYDARRLENPPLSSLMAPLRIGIETKMAFGTGTHETTRLMVGQLLDMDLQGKRVLDCGCGTGILGIAASKLGASEVVAYDIDEWSVENTRHNAALNGVENLQVLHGDSGVLTHVSGIFDVVLANINRNILLADMPHFADIMAASGVLLLSGFYAEDTPLLIAKAGELQLQLVGEASDNGWACLNFRKS